MAPDTSTGLAADPDQLWTYRDFAAWARVPERTVRHWANSPGGPRTVRLGRHVRIRVRDAMAWLDRQYDAEPEDAA